MLNVARYNGLLRHLCLAFLSVLGAACALHGTSGPSASISEADVAYPAWVLAAPGAHIEAGQRTFDAPGQIDGMRNAALARATADNRARAELARVLTIYFGAVIADVHNAQASAAQGGRLQVDHDALLKLLLAATLPSVQLVEHWFHPDRGAVFALARVELEDMHEHISRLREIPEGTLTLLLGRLEASHAAMFAATKA